MILADLSTVEAWDKDPLPRRGSGVTTLRASEAPIKPPHGIDLVMRFEPALDYGRPRSMVEQRKGDLDCKAGLERWYGSRMLLPPGFHSGPPGRPTVLMGWHNDSEAGPATPLIQWFVEGMHLKVRVRGGETGKDGATYTSEYDREVDCGPVTNRWLHIVQHSVWAPDATGTFMAEVNGRRVADVQGGNLYRRGDQVDQGYFFIGIYMPLEGVKSDDADPEAYNRIAFHADVVIAEHRVDLENRRRAQLRPLTGGAS